MQVDAMMSRGIITCYEDQDDFEAAELIGERPIRRLLALGISGATVGLLSLGDIAEHVSEEIAGQVLGEVCELRAQNEELRSADTTWRCGGS